MIRSSTDSPSRFTCTKTHQNARSASSIILHTSIPPDAANSQSVRNALCRSSDLILTLLNTSNPIQTRRLYQKPNVKLKQMVSWCPRLQLARIARPPTSGSPIHRLLSVEDLPTVMDPTRTKLDRRCRLKLRFLLEICRLDLAVGGARLCLHLL